MKVLAEIIREATSRETTTATYHSVKQPDVHLFMWPCRCWVKFRGPEPLPENAKLDDVWELMWACHWKWLEEGSCSTEHGSDGRPFVSPLDPLNKLTVQARAPTPPPMAKVLVLRPPAPLPPPPPPPVRPKKTPKTPEPVAPKVSRQDRKAQHDALIQKLIQESLERKRVLIGLIKGT